MFVKESPDRKKWINKQIKSKSDILGFIDNSGLDKIAPLARKAELKEEQDEIVKLQALDSSYVYGKSHFQDDDTRNNLVF